MNQFKILIADDLALIRSLLKQSLAEMKYSNVYEAADGTDCITKLMEAQKNKDPFNVLFLDWNMPGKNGLEVVQYCKINPQLRDLPIIMISAERDKSKVIQALKAGVNDYIVKPFQTSSLQAKLQRITPIKKAG